MTKDNTSLPGLLMNLRSHFDKGVNFTLLNRFSSMVSGVVLLGLVVTFFSQEVQGYYYTFNSLLLGQIFIELGFGIVLVQFISHECATLTFVDGGKIAGRQPALDRLRSLLKFSLGWYAALSLAFFILMGAFGQWFLRAPLDNRTPVFLPWWLLCFGVSANLSIVPFRCFLEGANQVHKSQAST
jgi:hypothetical protein